MSIKGKKQKDKKLTLDELDERLAALMAFCDETGTPPSDYQVMMHVGISPDTLERWRKDTDGVDERGEPIESGYAARIKKLDLYRNDFWLRRGMENPKVQGFAIFNLKQPHNGGYTDKPAGGGASLEVTIKHAGLGGDGAFK